MAKKTDKDDIVHMRLSKGEWWLICFLRNIKFHFKSVDSKRTTRKQVTVEEYNIIMGIRMNTYYEGIYRDSIAKVTVKSPLRQKGNKPPMYEELEAEYEERKDSFNSTIEKSYIRRLFFDIETSPMVVTSFQLGSKISITHHDILREWAIICICYKWEGKDKVYSLTWDENMDDKDMLREFITIAASAHEIIGHNSKRFDIKKIRTRCYYHSIPMMPFYQELDTLQLSRREFSFASNKLDYISQYKGHPDSGKIKTTKSLWHRCMDNEREALNEMVEYCKKDVQILEDTWRELVKYNSKPSILAQYTDSAKYACPVCANEHIETPIRQYTPTGMPRYLVTCRSCGYKYRISGAIYADYIRNNIDRDE